MSKEFDFLNIISSILDNSDYLGDDCAFLKEYGLTISKDCLIEDVHFSLLYMTPLEIARKALLVNISDILASGAKPKYALVGLSGKLDEKFVIDFYNGINEILKEYDIKIIGGDLTKSEKILISITILGDCKKRNISSRKNAKDNYIIATVGEFGTSAKGLEDLLNGEKDNYFIEYHKKPILYPEISKKIATIAKKPYAMMDSSDGLFDCLYQISTKSNIRINVQYDKIPKKINDRNLVLYGGEDYSLVVCLDKNDFDNIDDLVQIGTCQSGDGVYIDNIKEEYRGFEHFE